jgi:succinate dehydrogenase/fumarate reductase flavoprotein subunit
MAIGGKGIDMDKVQVHPTGLVDPKEPHAKVKFLAAEALRGVGGLLLDSGGERFIDELEKRDVVSEAMWKRDKFPVRLVLNTKAAKEIQWHVKHYEGTPFKNVANIGRGLMRHFKSGADLAKEIGIETSKLESVFKDYNEYASGNKKDPFGKKFFQNYPFEINDEFHVALMEPVLHFTMGGVEIDDQSRILIEDGKKPLEGLWACGELAGGVHGSNRLGGSALLGCVVYGRVAGAGAANYLFQNLLKSEGGASSPQSRLQQISLHIDPARPGRITVDWNSGAGASGDQPEGQVSTSAVQNDSASAGYDAAKVKKPSKKLEVPDKQFSLDEIAKHNTKEDCWVAVNGMALNVTDFLENHPGGPKAILLYAGKDATEEFNMLHDKNVIEVYLSSSPLMTRNTPQRQFRAHSKSRKIVIGLHLHRSINVGAFLTCHSLSL